MTIFPQQGLPQDTRAADPAAQLAPARPVSLRSVTIGLGLIPLNIIWVVLMERVDGRAFSTTISLFFTAVLSLLLVTAANALLRRGMPRYALRQGELLTIFSMVSIATAMAGVDLLSPLITLMGHAAWFATPENGWQKFLHDLPAWLTVSDRQALQGYYLGNSSLYRWEALRAWLPPLCWWTLFLMVLLWVMACLNTLLRAQWTEKERLTYPMVQLPLAMTAEDGGLFRSRLFWMGFALAGGLNFINGLHFLFPIVPALTFNGFDAAQWFPTPPWNAIGWTPLAIFPFVVGLGYLLPVDLLFSCWFFFLFWRAEKVVGAALGYMADQPLFPYVDEQMLGGYMAICAFALWTARHHLRAAWRKATGQETTLSDAREPLHFRTAVWGALGGFLFLVMFSHYAGLPVWLAVIFFLIYFAIAISVTRMRAELGPPTHDLHHIGPNITLYTVIGSRNLDGPTLGVFTLYNWFNRAYRCHPMPHQMEGFKMAQVSGTSSRGLLRAMLLAALVGVIATFWVTLHVSYRLGAAARIHGWSSLGFGNEGYDRLSSWLATPSGPDTGAISGMILGFLIASGLILIKMNVYGWPFHALGFSISGGWSMSWAWLSLFVAWVLKALILRYSGLRGYRAGLPLFFGVILGDFLIGGIWTLLGLCFDMPIYSLWSG
jgi:hypothetical protein